MSGLWGEPYQWVKWVHRNLSENHCPECLMLDECYFKKDNHPPHPHHSYCHCILENVAQSTIKKHATAHADYRKFDPFLFNVGKKYTHGKEKMFESWGYNVNDSNYLKSEIEKQGLEKYLAGEYKLGVLNKYGQRISIRIEMPRKDTDGTVSFVTGWTVHSNGIIKLNTPFGGK